MNITRATTKVLPNNFRDHFKNIRNRRDLLRRQKVEKHEVERRAYVYMARNTTLPPVVRYRAQLALNALHEKAPGPSHVKARCVDSGRGRGVLTKFGLCRYQFRIQALTDKIPGFHKSSW